MSESKDKTSDASNGARKPKWWTDSLETSWKKAKVEIMSDWDKVNEGEKKLEHSIAEAALAFGHGARDSYRKLDVWGAELEEKLAADWKETGHDAEYAWDKVSGAVKKGWERAADTAKSVVASVKSAVTTDTKPASTPTA